MHPELSINAYGINIKIIINLISVKNKTKYYCCLNGNRMVMVENGRETFR